MKRLLLALALALLLPSKVWATWSIIAIDRATGRVVISSSTCAANAPDQLKLLQAIVLPGVGVAAAQAGVDGTHANQKLIFEHMRMGTDPAEILRLVEAQEAAKPNGSSLQSRQFGIIDMQGRTAGFSGSGNGNFSRHYLGISDDGKLVYGVQGNIIKTEEALIEAAQIMKTDRSEMLDRVMLAMEKANSLGGDSRCTCTSGGGGAIPGLPCTNRTTSVGYILAADPGDARGTYAENHPQVTGNSNGATDLRAPWNDGDYYLYIAVYPGNFRTNEDAAPVCAMRLRYDQWVAQGRPRMNLAAAAPTPLRMQQPRPAAAEGQAAAPGGGRGGGGGGGGGGGRGGGAAQPGGGGGRGGQAAQPPAPYTGPTTAACARAASALPS